MPASARAPTFVTHANEIKTVDSEVDDMPLPDIEPMNAIHHPFVLAEQL